MNLTDVEQQLFFIVGCGRSGTTLAQVMLSSHPDVMLPAETGFYSIFYKENVSKLGELSEPENFNRALETVFNFYRIKDLELDFEEVSSKCQTRKKTGKQSFYLSLLHLLKSIM